MTTFWIAILVMVLAIVGVSVAVGMSLKDSTRHRASREEMLALKTSGAFSHRKSNMDGE
jgi:hypothetical protein